MSAAVFGPWWRVVNAVEIEQAVSALAEAPFDADSFPFRFLEAFGDKPSTIERLRKGESNHSDCGGVLQIGTIHIATCTKGHVTQTLARLKASPANVRHKVRFVLATDGEMFEADRTQKQRCGLSTDELRNEQNPSQFRAQDDFPSGVRQCKIKQAVMSNELYSAAS